MPPKSKPKQLQAQAFRWDVFIIDLASRVGVAGSVVLIVLLFFILKGSNDQHKEFFDKFLLLKFGPGHDFYLYFIITCLVILLIAQALYFRSRFKLKDEKIKDLSDERDRLQKLLID